VLLCSVDDPGPFAERIARHAERRPAAGRRRTTSSPSSRPVGLGRAGGWLLLRCENGSGHEQGGPETECGEQRKA
jgi:hypothetical protein